MCIQSKKAFNAGYKLLLVNTEYYSFQSGYIKTVISTRLQTRAKSGDLYSLLYIDINKLNWLALGHLYDQTLDIDRHESVTKVAL